MLEELKQAARRFSREEALAPLAYRERAVRWLIELDAEGGATLKGPYEKKEARRFAVPLRDDRSGKISRDNLKPYLLADDGRYALGIAEPGKEEEASIAHEGFRALVAGALAATGDEDVGLVHRFLSRPLPDDIARRVGPKDTVLFQCGVDRYPTDNAAVQQFWSSHLKKELAAKFSATCAVCGRHGPVLQVLPAGVTIMGQDCAITSFNAPAYFSLGKEQTANAPLCYDCAGQSAAALRHLTTRENHHAVLMRDESRAGRPNPLRNQLAVYWLKERQAVQVEDEVLDLEAALGALLRGEEPVGDAGPAPELGQLARLVKSPWKPAEGALRLEDNAFYLAVLSANRGRLVVRDWLGIPLAELRAHLGDYLRAARIVDPFGQAARAFPLPTLLTAATSPDPFATRARLRPEQANPNLNRGLLRSAYLGTPPPEGLLYAATRRFSVPKAREDVRCAHAVASALKLVLTHGKEEAETMQQLDESRRSSPYLCGRLLAVLEEAQRKAASTRLNTTVVDRYYGAVSTHPAVYFVSLVKLAETAHLPKIRKNNRGYEAMSALLTEVMDGIDRAGGFPRTCRLVEQADFALGFYHQRAAFNAQRPWLKPQADNAQGGDKR